MGGSQKSKRVSWASDEYLCQVRLFLSEESPSQVASGAQDHLQAKTSWASIPSAMLPDENLPPGFEGSQPAHVWRNNLSQIPLIKWRCPPKYIINGSWRVVAGDESKELEVQNQREMRVLEAIYPRASAIPSNPSMLLVAEDSSHHDQGPLIPITPIEDEDVSADMLNDSAAVDTVPMSLQPQPTAPGTSLDPDVLAAVHSALSTLMGNNNQGNIVDQELLIKILSDPKMIEQLVRTHGAVTSTQPAPQNVQSFPMTNMQRMVPSATQGLHVPGMANSFRAMSAAVSLPTSASHPVSRTDLHLAYVTRPELVAPAPAGLFYPPPSQVVPPPNSRPVVHETVPATAPVTGPSAPVTKDMNYYKSLIQQHGGERQDSMPMPQPGIQSNHQLATLNNFKQRDLKPKVMKPCIYFNTPRGCRNGANCTFQHNATSQQRVNNSIPDSQNSKRMKMDREITGT